MHVCVSMFANSNALPMHPPHLYFRIVVTFTLLYIAFRKCIALGWVVKRQTTHPFPVIQFSVVTWIHYID
jgi:hypothetical protein